MTIASGTCGDNLTWTLNDDYSLVIEGTGAMTDYTSDGAPWYSYYTQMTSLTLPSGLTSIGNNAFHACSGFTGTLTIPSSVTSIGSHAFDGCMGFTGTLTIPSSVTSIESSVFYDCFGFTSLTIPSSVTSIGSYAFYGCFSLTDIVLRQSTSPLMYVDCFALGESSEPVTATVKSSNNWAASVLDSYKNEYTTFVYEVISETYKKLTYNSKKIQVESAIRDGNGVKIDTNYRKNPKVIEYTVPNTVSTSQKYVIAEYNGTYDGSPGYVKFIMEVTSSSYKGIYVVEATWGLANGGITLISGNATINDVSGLYLHYPSSTSNYAYPPVLSAYNTSTSEKQVKITLLEDSGDLTWKTNWGTTVSETGRTGINVYFANTAQISNADHASTATGATYASRLNPAVVTFLPTASGVRFCRDLTILSKTDVWFIETYTYNPYQFQRATAMSDPSEVAVRTSTDNGSTWTNWTYSYAVWHS